MKNGEDAAVESEKSKKSAASLPVDRVAAQPMEIKQ